MFGRQETIDLPERAHRGVDILGEMRAMCMAVQDVTMDENKPATDNNLETTLKLMHEMTKNAEHEMHAVVLFL